jgi:hypothetical protein
MPPPKTVQAVVYVNSSNEAVVFPPVLLAAKTDTVEIFNATGDDVVAIFPGDVFDQESGGPTPPIDPQKSARVVPNNDKRGKKISGATQKKGRVPYKVFSFKTNDFAKGNSDPEFIIEP